MIYHFMTQIVTGITLILGISGFTGIQQSQNTETNLNITPVTTGELGRRVELHNRRMHDQNLYGVEHVFQPAGYSWPGDWEGRTILALALEARLKNERDPELEAILSALPDHLNAKGYMGNLYDDGTVDEQLLSSHGWLLRGLCESYLGNNDPALLRRIHIIIDNLVPPLAGEYKKYPMTVESRTLDGGPSGSIVAQKSGNWLLSTDIGCAFIFFDGLVQALEITGRLKEFQPICEEIVDKFSQINLIAIKAQTHASLTMGRGLMRYWKLTQYPPALQMAKQVFATYLREGMSAHYANYNWFDRPDTWTEPCAIVDSFILAMQLYRATSDAHYLDTALRIWHTGVERAQRPNGGFGGDNCPRPGQEDIAVAFYEATWCCTMRGGEGLFERAASAASLENGILEIYLPAALNFISSDGEFTLETDYPHTADAKLTIHRLPANLKTIAYALVPGAKLGTVKVSDQSGKEYSFRLQGNGLVAFDGPFSEGMVLSITMPIEIECLPAVNDPSGQLKTYWYGAMMLGSIPGSSPSLPLTKIGPGCFSDATGMKVEALQRMWLIPDLPTANDTFGADEAAKAATTRRILFDH